LCAGDIILFLHIVPMMAALALRAHAPQEEYSARLRRLDFTLMMGLVDVSLHFRRDGVGSMSFPISSL